MLGAKYARRAYELRGPISEPEKFYVESTWYHYIVGDLNRARQIYEVWAQTYPRNSSPRIRLAQLYCAEGKYEDALPQIREAIRLDPWKGVSPMNLVRILIRLNRFEEASNSAQQEISNGFDSSDLRLRLYLLSFLENDAAAMARQVQWITGKPTEASMLELRANTAAYFGRLQEARALSQRAADSAMHSQEREVAASFEANASLAEALSGRMVDVSLPVRSRAALSAGRGTQYAMALSFALVADSNRGQALADDLRRRYPDDTLVQFNFLPAIRAQIALNRHDPGTALDVLRSAEPYELSDSWWGFLGPVYIRGEAYLMAHRGTEAAAEFQKIIDHRGVVENAAIGALAFLQLGRAYALSGDKENAKTAYQEFLTLWTNADPDIPVFKQARAEYRKLNEKAQ